MVTLKDAILFASVLGIFFGAIAILPAMWDASKTRSKIMEEVDKNVKDLSKLKDPYLFLWSEFYREYRRNNKEYEYLE